VPARAPNEPKLLDYLFDADDQAFGALNTSLQTFLLTERMRASGKPAVRVSAANTRDLYWTFAQMVAHHTSGGCPLRPGDLFGSGTISGPQRDGYGSLIELTDGGGAPIDLGDGEVRAFLEDGDEVIFRARCERDGFVAIGFGECRGRIVSELR
jgi:fumarylacetoacetase